MYAQRGDEYKLAPQEKPLSYGSYNHQNPMKSFAGEVETAPLSDLRKLANWTQTLEKKVDIMSQTCCASGPAPAPKPGPAPAPRPVPTPVKPAGPGAHDWAFNGTTCMKVRPGAGGYDSVQECMLDKSRVV
jgi:hypothetical protein